MQNKNALPPQCNFILNSLHLTERDYFMMMNDFHILTQRQWTLCTSHYNARSV